MTTPDPVVVPATNDQTVTPDPPVEESQSQEPVDNPAWQPIWDEFENDPAMKYIAPRLKEKLRPHLTKQDLAFQDQATKLAQWKDFENIPPDYLRTSVNTFNVLNQDPKKFHELLSQELGITVAEAKQITKELEKDTQDPAGDGEPVDPRLKQLEDKTNELISAEQKRQYDNTVTQEGQKIDADLAKIKAAHEANTALVGIPFDDEAVHAVLQLARIDLLDQQAKGVKNPQVNVDAAYKQHVAQILKWRSFPTPGSRAPVVTPTGGGGTSLPLNQESGRIPDDVIRGGKEARIAWFMKNRANNLQ